MKIKNTLIIAIVAAVIIAGIETFRFYTELEECRNAMEREQLKQDSLKVANQQLTDQIAGLNTYNAALTEKVSRLTNLLVNTNLPTEKKENERRK